MKYLKKKKKNLYKFSSYNDLAITVVISNIHCKNCSINNKGILLIKYLKKLNVNIYYSI